MSSGGSEVEQKVEDVFELYTRIARKKLSKSKRIYTEQLVVWLMVLQNLLAKSSARSIIPAVLTKEAESFLGNCKRVRERKISVTSSGFCQARSELPSEVFLPLMNELSESLMEETVRWNGRQVLILDGMTLRLQTREDMVERFPPHKNQISTSIFPLVRTVVVHDAFSGLALEPEIGDAKESAKISEPRLAAKIFQRLKEGNIILADRAYGGYPTAFRAIKPGNDIVFRIQKSHIKSIVGTEHPDLGVYNVTWKPSKKVLEEHPDIAPDSEIKGRLIVSKLNDPEKPELLYLFTSLKEESVLDVIKLYARRWAIETDIRHFKSTLENTQLSSTTSGMVKKELLASVLAYNLVRATIILAADHHKMEINQFSFTVVLRLLEQATVRIVHAKNNKERKQILDFLIHTCIAGKKYKDKRTSQPRVAYRIPIRYNPRSRPHYAM